MKVNRLQVEDWLYLYFHDIKENQPELKEKLLDAFETLSSETVLPRQYYLLSLATIMEAAEQLQD